MGGDQVFVVEKNQGDRGVIIDKSILSEECYNASVWDDEVRVSKTELATILADANDICFQVCFNTKASEKSALAVLSELKKKPSKEAELRELA